MKLLILGLAASAIADVTFPVNNVKPLPLPNDGYIVSSEQLFNLSCPDEAQFPNGSHANVLLSTYSPFGESEKHVFSSKGKGKSSSYIFPSSASFVRGAMDSWAQHQHLVLRPDEVWFEILVQMNFYMSSHAEEIRDLFVDFEGKQEIKVFKFTWRDVIGSFSQEIAKRVKTKWLLDWIMPGFTTSGQEEEMTATVLMMGLLQHYFTFAGGITCGIPKITLMGTKIDWERLLDKLDRLKEFGKEPSAYAEQLRPILSRFVKTFDNPTDPALRHFWQQIVRVQKHFSCGAGPTEFDVSGWIVGFLYWNPDGKLRITPQMQENKTREEDYQLDGKKYMAQPMDKLYVGYAKAPLKMINYPEPGVDTMAYVVGGNIGINRTVVAKNEPVQLQPMSSWYLVVNGRNETSRRSDHGSFSELQGIARDFDDQKCGLADNDSM